ncbi:hypothetical protein [Sagittula stellata]|nr:hypothetical protein [Sagittula stellata]
MPAFKVSAADPSTPNMDRDHDLDDAPLFCDAIRPTTPRRT